MARYTQYESFPSQAQLDPYKIDKALCQERLLQKHDQKGNQFIAGSDTARELSVGQSFMFAGNARVYEVFPNIWTVTHAPSMFTDVHHQIRDVDKKSLNIAKFFVTTLHSDPRGKAWVCAWWLPSYVTDSKELAKQPVVVLEEAKNLVLAKRAMKKHVAAFNKKIQETLDEVGLSPTQKNKQLPFEYRNWNGRIVPSKVKYHVSQLVTYVATKGTYVAEIVGSAYTGSQITAWENMRSPHYSTFNATEISLGTNRYGGRNDHTMLTPASVDLTLPNSIKLKLVSPVLHNDSKRIGKTLTISVNSNFEKKLKPLSIVDLGVTLLNFQNMMKTFVE